MYDFDQLDFYQLLQVARTATTDEIKRAYRREISKYHPDRYATGSAAELAYAQARSARLTEAYTTLSDTASRFAYNRGEMPSRRSNRAPVADAPPRDYQAELYAQAEDHLANGRTLQAVAVLRQLQQINPFYPNSDRLLERAEAQLGNQQHSRSESRQRSSSRALLIGGGLAGLALVGAATWALAQRTPTTVSVASQATVPILSTAERVTAPPAPTTGSTVGPVLAATAAATRAPTAAPTRVPTTLPTTAPTAAPTLKPTAAPTLVPTVPPAIAEGGDLLINDDFTTPNWASVAGIGWSVGYAQTGYRITVDPGIGAIWSYRSGMPANASLGVDVQAMSGEGGVLLWFTDESGFISYVINPTTRTYRAEQRVAGITNVLATGSSDAIARGSNATNRLAARIVDGTMQLFVNETLLESVNISAVPYTQRYGLLAVSGPSAADVRFSNLAIRTAQE